MSATFTATRPQLLLRGQRLARRAAACPPLKNAIVRRSAACRRAGWQPPALNNQVLLPLLLLCSRGEGGRCACAAAAAAAAASTAAARTADAADDDQLLAPYAPTVAAALSRLQAARDALLGGGGHHRRDEGGGADEQPQRLDALLGELELAAEALARPARFVADFGSDPGRRDAAAGLHAHAARAVAAVYGDAALQCRLLDGCRAALERFLCVGGNDAAGSEHNGGADAAPFLAAAAELARAMDDALYASDDDDDAGGGDGDDVALLMTWRFLLRSAMAAQAPLACDDGGDDDAALVRRLEGALSAFGRLTLDEAATPLLLLTEAQAALLRPMLADAGLERRAWWLGTQKPLAAEVGDDEFVEVPCAVALQLWRDGAGGSGGELELDDLCTATEAAVAALDGADALTPQLSSSSSSRLADGDGDTCKLRVLRVLRVPASAQLAVLALTRDVTMLLLQQHGHSGVRRQVYESGLLRRRAALLAALGAAAAVRAELAAARGAQSYADLLLDGSVARTRGTAAAALLELAAGVAPYAASDARDLEALARRARARGDDDGAGGGGTGSCLEPWDVDFYMAQAMREAALGSSWRDYAPYFTLPSLLSGLDRLLAVVAGLRLLPPGVQPPRSFFESGGGDEELSRSGSDTEAFTPAAEASDFVPGGNDTDDNNDHSAEPELPPWAPGAPPARLVLWHPDWRRGIGEVHFAIATPGGFPFTTLLRQPEPSAGAEDGGLMPFTPGAALVRLPLDVADAETGELRGPFGVRALLHETGHALALLLGGARAAASRGSGGGCSSSLAAAAALGGAASPLDLRELPSHALEHAARDPAALRLLSCHARLGVPLPARDAARAARYLATAHALSALDLHEQLLAAAADLSAHGPLMMIPTAAAAASSPSPTTTGGADASAAATAAVTAAYDAVWAAHSVLLPASSSRGAAAAAGLEQLRNLEAGGSVGGAKYAYAAARLLAAAVWKAHASPLAGGGSDGARALRERLFGAGARAPAPRLVRALLGPGALRRFDDSGVTSSGWVPDLGADAFQDVDLLG